MKKIIIVLLLLAGIQPILSQQNFTDYWYYATKSSNFYIDITQTGDSIKGNLCAVMDNGNRMDCPEDSITVKGIVVGNVGNVDFFSDFANAWGKATMTKISNAQIQWKITVRPNGGTCFIPAEAILTSSKVDCAGVMNGTAHLDDCDSCAGGTTGKLPCTYFDDHTKSLGDELDARICDYISTELNTVPGIIYSANYPNDPNYPTDPGHPYAAYSYKNYVIYVSPPFFTELTSDDDRLAVLFHEYARTLDYTNYPAAIYPMARDANGILLSVNTGSYTYYCSNFWQDEISALQIEQWGEEIGMYTMTDAYRQSVNARILAAQAELKKALAFEAQNGYNPDGTKK